MFITTKQELKDKIFRMMGSEIHTVEITELQWEDIYNTALKRIWEDSEDGSTERVVNIQINDVRELKVDERILAITKVFTNVSFSQDIPMMEFTTDLVFKAMRSSGNGDESIIGKIIGLNQSIQNMKNAMFQQVDYRFNAETKMLYIHGQVKEINILALVAEEEENLFDSTAFQKLLLAGCFRQWARNLSKYGTGNIQIMGNGLELNVEYMTNEADRLEQEIDELFENDAFSVVCGVRTLY